MLRLGLAVPVGALRFGRRRRPLPRPSPRPHILILGGGFAGLGAALRLSPTHHRVTLIDRTRWFEFLPNIHELLSGVKTPELLRLPLDRIVRRAGHAFARDRVTAIDLASRTVRTRRRVLHYDALIVAFGGVDAARGVGGVEEHAHPFKSVDQCARIGARLERLAKRRRATDVVIVGGGLEGVEALGEILRRYREQGCFRIALVEARDRLLPEAPAAIDREVRRLSEPYDVQFCTRASVRAIEKGCVALESGESLPSDLTIWTGGPAPAELLSESGLAPHSQWAPVGVTLQVPTHPEVFVAGDAAGLPTPLSKQGYHALDMGEAAARNAERWLADRTLQRYRPSGKPTLISFGDLSCFLVAGERVLAGPALGALKESIFELVMAQLDREPLPQQLTRIANRLDRAARRVLWPAVSSPRSLARQAHFSVLSLG